MELTVFRSQDIDTVFAIQQAAYKPLYDKYHDDGNPYLETRETVFQKYTRPGTVGYLFLREGIPAGTVRVALNPGAREGRIFALAVHPRYQGQGIAQQALVQIEQRHPDVERWTLDTILQEPGNCHLYEKLGYRQTGKMEPISENMALVFYEKTTAPSLTFRRAREEELDTILALYKSMLGLPFCAWTEDYPSTEELNRDHRAGTLYVLAEGKRILGALSVVPERELDDQPCWVCRDGNHREIARICVAREARGRGLAGCMVAAIAEKLRSEGCTAIHLSAAKGNLPARKTYENQGFRVAGEAALYGGEYLLLEKLLDQMSLASLPESSYNKK